MSERAEPSEGERVAVQQAVWYARQEGRRVRKEEPPESGKNQPLSPGQTRRPLARRVRLDHTRVTRDHHFGGPSFVCSLWFPLVMTQLSITSSLTLNARQTAMRETPKCSAICPDSHAGVRHLPRLTPL
jgi:hypothetical protein